MSTNINPAQLLSETSEILALAAKMFGASNTNSNVNGDDDDAGSTSSQPQSMGSTPSDLGLSGEDTNQVGLKSFTGNDWGDPHLNVDYTLGQNGFSSADSTSGGSATGSSKWDSMESQKDLLSSTNQFGGFHFSTDVTSPINSNGVTLNKEFTARFGGGNSIDFNTSNGSAPSVTIDGKVEQMKEGQSYQLNAATTATFQDGKLTITQNDGDAHLSTTVSNNGGHLDIHTEGKNLEVGGSLVKPAETASSKQNSNSNNQLEQEIIKLAMEALELSETAMKMASTAKPADSEDDMSRFVEPSIF